MNLFSAITFPLSKSREPQQVVSDSWSRRSDILKKDVNLFCWKRPSVEPIEEYLKQVTEDMPEPIQATVNLDNLAECIAQEKSKWTNSCRDGMDGFWRDVATLTQDFLNLSNSKIGTIHLKIITNNACAKFHTDGYTLRLFTTYLGRGTEWLPEKITYRKGLGKSNELIVRDPAGVRRMEPFEVGILKGQLPNSPEANRAIVHRSPEISGTGEKRVIFRIDV